MRVSHFHHYRGKKEIKKTPSAGSVALFHLGNKPFEQALIAKCILAQVLYHARSLFSKVFNSLRDEVEVGIPEPIGVVGRILGEISIAMEVCTLSFQHVKNTIDSAKGARPPTARTAMHQHRPLALRLRLLTVEAGVAGGLDDLVALLNQMK